MGTYILASKARPKLMRGQETRLYDVMEGLGGGPLTLAQIVRQCENLSYASLLRTETSVENSVKYHLRRWSKRDLVKKLQ
jgi:hypothetical protein